MGYMRHQSSLYEALTLDPAIPRKTKHFLETGTVFCDVHNNPVNMAQHSQL